MEGDINKLRQWCIKKKLKGMKVSEICAHARIERSTFYFWWAKYREHGITGLEPMSRKPKTMHSTPGDIVERVIELRKRTGHNEKAIAAELGIGHSTVYRILKAESLLKCIKKPRRKRTYKSWSREHPDSLWQTDLCIYKRKYLATFMDDCSRFVLVIDIFKQGTTQNVLNLFQRAIDQYGKPREVLTDHGTQYYSVRGGTSEFDRFCVDNGIKHILGGIGKPTTLGKIERFHRTFREMYPRFSSLEEFQKCYNFERPHGGIGYAFPADIYLGKVSNMS